MRVPEQLILADSATHSGQDEPPVLQNEAAKVGHPLEATMLALFEPRFKDNSFKIVNAALETEGTGDWPRYSGQLRAHRHFEIRQGGGGIEQVPEGPQAAARGFRGKFTDPRITATSPSQRGG